MKRATARVCAAALAVSASLRIVESVQAVPVSFSATFNGEWQSPSTWATSTPGADHDVPVAGDTAIINSGFGVSVAEDNTVANFNLSGGSVTFQSSSAVNVTGTGTWSSGTIQTTFPPVSLGSINFTGTNFFFTTSGTKTVGAIFSDTGTVQVQGAGTIQTVNGTFVSGEIINRAGGLFDLQSDATISIPTGTIGFVNSGTLRKSGGAFSTITGNGFPDFSNNNGTIQVNTGSVSIVNGEYVNSGTFIVAAGSSLSLTTSNSSANDQLSGTLSGSGTGSIIFNGSYAVASPGATLNFSGNQFQWTGGQVNGAVAPLTNIGTITVSGTNATAVGVFNNAGRIIVTNGTTMRVGLTSHGTLNNLAGGVIEAQGSINFNSFFDANSTINNSGLFLKTGAGSTGLNNSLGFANNGGTVQCSGGTLQLAHGNNTGGGTYIADAGANIILTGVSADSSTYSGTFNGSGAGSIATSFGNLSAAGTGATFNFTGSGLQLLAGTFIGSDAAPFVNIGTMTAGGGNGPQFSGRFNNMGRLNAGTNISISAASGTSAFYNSGTVDMNGVDAGIIGSATGIFNNTGTLLKSATGQATNNSPFVNNGTINAQSGTMVLSGGANGNGTYTAAAGATLSLTGFTNPAITLGGTFLGTPVGTVQLTGSFNSSGSGATFNFAGTGLQLNNVQLTGTAAAPFVNVGTAIALGTTVSGRFDNSGTMQQKSTGNLSLTSATFNNLAGALYDIQNDQQIAGFGAGSAIFNNAGMLTKSAGTSSSSDISATINNTGTVQASVGRINVVTGVTGDGTYTALAGATVSFQGAFSAPACALAGTLRGSPAGLLGILSSTLTTAGSGATLNFSGTGFQLAPPGAATFGGTAAAPLTNVGTVISGAGAGIAHLSGQFDNRANVIQKSSSSLDLLNSATFNNFAGATFDVQADTGLTGPASGTLPVFSNAGVFLKSAGTGTATIASGITFDNTGTIEARSGTISFAGTPVQANGTMLTGGTWRALGANINFNGGSNITINKGTILLSGASATFARINSFSDNQGEFQIAGGKTWTTVASFSNSGAVIANGAGSTFTVSSQLFQYSGTTLTGGTWIALNGGTIAFPAGGTITTNQGSVTLSGIGSTFAAINSLNNNQGSFTIANSRPFTTVGALANSGRFITNSATGTISGNLTNSGTLEMDNFGVFVLNGATATNSGSIAINDNSDLRIGASTVTLSGGGTVTLLGSSSRIIGNSTGNERLVNSDNTIGGAGQIGANFMSFTNDATVNANVPGQSLTIDPGSGGAINIGFMKASGGGVLQLSGGNFTNTGATIRVDSTSGTSTVSFSAANVTGGFIDCIGAQSGVLTLASSSSFTGGTLTGNATSTILNSANANTLGGTINAGAGSLVVSSGSTLTFAGGASINSSGTVLINAGGVVTFPGTATFTSSGTVSLPSGASLVIPTSVSFTSTGTVALDGSLTLNASVGTFGSVSGAGTFLQNGAFSSTATHFRVGTLSTLTGGTLTVRAGNGTLGTSKVGTLSLPGTSRLNLDDHDLIVDYTGASPLASIKALIVSGYNSGSWTGAGIVTGMSAGGHALGYAEASQLGVSTFSGQSVDSTAVLVKYTFTGDANLDGSVNALDFNNIAINFGGSSKNWFNGDFNFDGNVNTQDFTILGTNFGKLVPPAPPVLGSLVPEPAVSLIVISIPILSARRRRRA